MRKRFLVHILKVLMSTVLAPKAWADASPQRVVLEPFLRSDFPVPYLRRGEWMEACFVINLSIRPDRWQYAQRTLAVLDVVPNRVPGVLGRDLPLEALKSIGVPWAADLAPCRIRSWSSGQCRDGPVQGARGCVFKHRLSMGAIGCTLSHLSILKRAEELDLNRIWILEDDPVVLCSTEAVQNLINKADDALGEKGWDIVFTDHRAPTRPFRADYERWNDSPLVSFGELEMVKARWGTYSMIVNRAARKKILEFFSQRGIFGPYDHDLFFVPHLVCLQPHEGSEQVTFTRDFGSDIVD
jgi:GR25 family glycosyltransferase involved in LPS biosynthesis